MHPRYRILGAGASWLLADGTMTSTVRVWDEETGADEAFSSGTYELVAASGTTLLAETAVSAGSGQVDKSVTLSGQTPGLARETWTFTITADSSIVRLDRIVGIASVPVVPMVGTADVNARHTLLSAAYPTGQTSWREQVGAAWDVIVERALRHTAGPDIWTPSHLRLPHLLLSCAFAFRELSSFTGDDYAEKAREYETAYDNAWGRMRAHVDTDNDGDRDGEASPVVPERGPAPFGRRG
jgi:hypothetical protein